MAFQVEAWWSANYNKYSIRDMQRLPVFHRFIQIHYPFELSTDAVHERFRTEDEQVDIFEWTDKVTQRYEKFAHDRKLRQYHYEAHFTDEESPIVISSWFQQDLEWGTITRKYEGYEVSEGWRLEPPNRTYERFTLERGIKRGFRAGIFPYKGEYERWVEEIWEIEDEKMFSKQWYKQGDSGGETTNAKGPYTWGENWFSNSSREEKKCWHKDGTHEWGHDKGRERAGPRRWDHTWDFDVNDKYEEKVSVTKGRDTGYRYWGHDNDWYKQEWEGLRLLEREDRCEEVVNSKFRTRLDDLYVSEHNGSLRQQQTLKTLQQYLPEFADRVKALDDRRADIHAKDRESIEQLFDSIEGLRGVQDDQEKLTQEMIGAFRDQLATVGRLNHFFEASLDNSLATLKMIGDILEDPTAHDELAKEVQAWKDNKGTPAEHADAAMKLLDKLENTKRDELAKFKGGIPKEELESIMNLLYEVMVKHDTVSDKIVELTHADDLKGKLDGMEDTFEQIHKNFLDEGDPNKLREMITLLREYQPIHLVLLGRLQGYKPSESDSEIQRIADAVAETKAAPSLKNSRQKVRSGRPTRDMPHQATDKNLGKFAQAFQKLLAAVNAPKEDIEKLNTFGDKTVDSTETVNVLVEKTQTLLDIVLRADPAVDAHNASLKATDDNLNTYFTKEAEVLSAFPEGESLALERKELVDKSPTTEYLPPLVQKKSELLADGLTAVKDYNDLVLAKRVQIGELLEKFVPYFIKHLKSVSAPESAINALQEAMKLPENPVYPLESLAAKAEALCTQAEVTDPNLDEHNDNLKQIDAQINNYFEKLLEQLKKVPNSDEEAAKVKDLVARSEDTTYFPPLLLEKAKELDTLANILANSDEKFREPIDRLSASLRKFIPYFVTHLKTVNHLDTDALSELATKPQDDNYPLEVLADQAESLLENAVGAEPKLVDHVDTIKKSDANINEYFEKTFPYYDGIEGAEEGIIAPRQALIDETATTEYLPPLVQRKTEELLAHWEEVIAYIITITTEQTDTLSIVEELQRTINDKSELIDQLQKKIKELEKNIGLLKDDLEAANKYKPLFEDRDALATKLGIEVKDLTVKNGDLTLERDQLKSQNDEYAAQVKDLSDFKVRALDLEQENQRLQGIIRTYDDMFGSKKEQFEHVIDALNRQIAERDAKIKELLDRIAALEKELGIKDNDRKRQLMLRVIGSLSNTLKVERTSTFLQWKFWSMAPEDIPPETILEEVPECAGFLDETLVEPELQSFRDTEPPLVDERKQQILANIIARHWRLSALKFTRPSRPHEALTFWDKLLESKFQVDKEDIEGQKRPLLFSEYTLEHLLKTIGNRRSVDDLLATHIPTLYRLAKEGQTYASLISRMLQLFLGSPAPLEGQVLVVRYRQLFQELSQSYIKSREERKLEEKSELDLAASGGEALLKTVLDTFYGDLSGAQFIVEHWLRQIRPASLSLKKFILYLVYWKLRSTGGNAADFWSSVDPSGSGQADPEALVTAVQGLGLLVSTRLLKEASKTPVQKALFEEAGTINPEDDSLVVTKAAFLTGVLEAFLARIRRAAVIYTAEFAKKGKGHLDKNEFVATLSEIEPGHDASAVEKIYDEGLPLSGTKDGVDGPAFVRVWLRHLITPIGNPPVAIPELHFLVDPHVLEYNLETGIKQTVTTVKTTKTIVTTKKVTLKKG